MRVSLVAAWAAAVTLGAWATFNYVLGGWLGEDSHAYWLAGRTAHPYGAVPGARDAYLYSPVFAQAMRLVAWLPWPAFFVCFALASSAVFCWLARPLPWRWRVPVLLICWSEVLTGNISAFLAVALVVGVAGGGGLALPALTKVTPAGVGVLWHGVRGDWRQVLRAVLVSVVLAGVSFAVSPQLWFEWVRFLASHSGGGQQSFGPRALAALVVTVYAARRDRPAMLALAYWLAMPMAGLTMLQPMTVMVAAVRLTRPREASHGAPAPEGGERSVPR